MLMYQKYSCLFLLIQSALGFYGNLMLECSSGNCGSCGKYVYVDPDTSEQVPLCYKGKYDPDFLDSEFDPKGCCVGGSGSYPVTTCASANCGTCDKSTVGSNTYCTKGGMTISGNQYYSAQDPSTCCQAITVPSTVPSTAPSTAPSTTTTTTAIASTTPSPVSVVFNNLTSKQPTDLYYPLETNGVPYLMLKLCYLWNNPETADVEIIQVNGQNMVIWYYDLTMNDASPISPQVTTFMQSNSIKCNNAPSCQLMISNGIYPLFEVSMIKSMDMFTNYLGQGQQLLQCANRPENRFRYSYMKNNYARTSAITCDVCLQGTMNGLYIGDDKCVSDHESNRQNLFIGSSCTEPIPYTQLRSTVFSEVTNTTMKTYTLTTNLGIVELYRMCNIRCSEEDACDGFAVNWSNGLKCTLFKYNTGVKFVPGSDDIYLKPQVKINPIHCGVNPGFVFYKMCNGECISMSAECMTITTTTSTSTSTTATTSTSTSTTTTTSTSTTATTSTEPATTTLSSISKGSKLYINLTLLLSLLFGTFVVM